MFSKILIGSDGSEYTENAAVLASRIAEQFDSKVFVVNVVDLSFATGGVIGMWTVPIDSETTGICMASQLKAAECAVRPSFAEAKRPYELLQETGHPVAGILNVAERKHVDLIIVGSRGLTGLSEFFLGSVSHGVLHHAHCPVLIERGPAKRFKRILLASDGSPAAHKAASAAFALAKKFDACLTVLNVSEPTGWFTGPGEDPNPIVAIEEKIGSELDSKIVMESIQEASRVNGVTYAVHQARGHAGDSIVRYSEVGGYDLIVMGSRGLGGFDRLLLGSVSNYVAYHANCPILVVR